MRSGLDLLLPAALALHLALALSLRTDAWPDIVTPAYLWSRGLLMYRDIKFQHTPGTIGTLALAFSLLGVRTAVVRAYTVAGPLLAHVFILRETRPFPPAKRMLASAFFLVCLFSFEGNAVWPTVLLCTMAIPIAAALAHERMRSAGLQIGFAILFKQTAAYLLLLATVYLCVRRRFREAATLFLAASIPYLVTLVLFATLGAGGDMLRWTVQVPFKIRPEIAYVLPPPFPLFLLLTAFAPAAAEALLERSGEYKTSGRWLLAVAAGFALMCLPRFGMVQTVASLPPLAVGAARLMRRRRRWLQPAAVAFVATLTLSRGLALWTGEERDGKVRFWNDEPALNALIARLRLLPGETQLHSELWENVLPQSGLLPPGRVYVHPWFTWFFPVDRIGERVRRAAETPGTVIVGYRGLRPYGEAVGPYSLVRK